MWYVISFSPPVLSQDMLGDVPDQGHTNYIFLEEDLRGCETVLPPMNFGRFGMAKNRFKEIKRKSRFGPPPTDDDRWAFIDPMEDAFNARMVLIYVPGWLNTVDETMDPWTGPEGPGPDKIPARSFVPRKPEPLGAEVKCAADVRRQV